jgi:hypothetical protein
MQKGTLLLLIVVCIIYIMNYMYIQYQRLDGFSPNKKYALCLITYKPKPEWIEFLSTIDTYDIYIIVDDNSKTYSSKHTNIHFIQIDNEECRKHGFQNMNYFIGKEISGWDKALYYFSQVNTSYSQVWFLEDDVFFYNAKTLQEIDSSYDDTFDLVCPTFMGNHTDPWPHWSTIQIAFPPPYSFGMVCACRVSNKLLSVIRDYAKQEHTLFFLEALFPTLATRTSMRIGHPKEMETIVFRHDYSIHEITKHNIYHPVKDIRLHTVFRK